MPPIAPVLKTSPLSHTCRDVEWYWAACSLDSPGICWNTNEFLGYTMTGSSCYRINNIDCLGWRAVSGRQLCLAQSICYIIVCLCSITEPSQTLESQGKLTGKPGLCEWQG